MGRQDLLSAKERRYLFEVPTDREALARLYTFGSSDLGLIEAGSRNATAWEVRCGLR